MHYMFMKIEQKRTTDEMVTGERHRQKDRQSQWQSEKEIETPRIHIQPNR